MFFHIFYPIFPDDGEFLWDGHQGVFRSHMIKIGATYLKMYVGPNLKKRVDIQKANDIIMPFAWTISIIAQRLITLENCKLQTAAEPRVNYGGCSMAPLRSHEFSKG